MVRSGGRFLNEQLISLAKTENACFGHQDASNEADWYFSLGNKGIAEVADTTIMSKIIPFGRYLPRDS